MLETSIFGNLGWCHWTEKKKSAETKTRAWNWPHVSYNDPTEVGSCIENWLRFYWLDCIYLIQYEIGNSELGTWVHLVSFCKFGAKEVKVFLYRIIYFHNIFDLSPKTQAVWKVHRIRFRENIMVTFWVRAFQKNLIWSVPRYFYIDIISFDILVFFICLQNWTFSSQYR